MKAYRRWIGLLVFLVVCIGAGGVGALSTTPEIEGWYRTLNKPSWNPPDSLFGPVWTTLYVLMAIAGWLVWKSAGIRKTTLPLSLFGVQLVLNVAWSFLFFGLHRPGWAFVEIMVLWLTILATTFTFYRCSKPAGWLFLPYLAWVSFASFLNCAIWRMNV